jgi:hypothetical protein
MLGILDVPRFKELLDQFNEAVDRLKGMGVKVGAGSRLGTYSAALELLAKGYLPKDVGEMVDLAYSVMEADEIVDTVAAIRESDLNPELRQRLRDLPSDHADKAAEGSTARGRSSQFELYVRSLLRRAGLGVEMSSPDLAVTRSATRLTDLELKRPRTAQSLGWRFVRKSIGVPENLPGKPPEPSKAV